VTDWRQITARALFTGAQVLAKYPEGLPRQRLWRLITERLPGIEDEWAEATTASTTAVNNFGFYSINLVKAGWLRKERVPGRGWLWHLTPVGRAAMDEFPDPDSFWAGHEELYSDWEANRESFDRARELMGAIPYGHWAIAGDIASESGLAYGLHAGVSEVVRLVQWAQGERPPGWHQVLDADGGLPDDLSLSGSERDDWLRLLRDSSVTVAAGRAVLDGRIRASDLARLVDEPPPVEGLRRAWLIRGSNVQGESLIQSWLDRGICSLPAARLRHTLRSGASREQVRGAIDEDYADASTRRRAQMTADYYAFLTRMSDRDIVASYSGSGYYLGYITGPADFVTGDGGRSGLQRKVEWVNAEEPVDYEQLPDGLPARLGNPDAEVVELTEFAGELEQFLGEIPDQPVLDREAELLDIEPEFAQDLFMADSVDFLQECVDLLRDRPQMIFYGPPGTGKTHLARRLARQLTGDQPDNVRLVQFHPAYSYEDFFQGYRPREGDNGEVGFRPYNGPLKLLAEAAHERQGETYVLIIDEINRGNLAKIFGELYFLLEYRKESVIPTYSTLDDPGFSLPRNLVILGTMNTADRSIALVDAAIRRRFWFTELHPDAPPVKDLLQNWLRENELPPDSALLLDALNAAIQDRDFKIGPSFLMRKSVQSVAGIERVWRHQILPLLEEHHFGERDHDWVVNEYGLETLRERVGLPAPGGFAP
jgi:5-methylcytosine-specific restriction enzyme B